MPDPIITFRCPEDLKNRAEHIGAHHDLTLSQIIRKALREYVERNSAVEDRDVAVEKQTGP